MEGGLSSSLNAEEKEKLKKRLALLQKEYSRTVQRLQRAERSESVQRHVRSRITEQNCLLQEELGPARLPSPDFPLVNSLSKDVNVLPRTSDSADQSKSTAVHFSLPHEVLNYCVLSSEMWGSPGSTQLSDSPDPQSSSQERAVAQGEGRRSLSAHRLRSRRSRLRWERREQVGGGGISDTENSEEGSELIALRMGEKPGSPALRSSGGEEKNERSAFPEALPENCRGIESQDPSWGGTEEEVVGVRKDLMADLSISASLDLQDGPADPLRRTVLHSLPFPTSHQPPSDAGSPQLPGQTGGAQCRADCVLPALTPPKVETAESGLENGIFELEKGYPREINTPSTDKLLSPTPDTTGGGGLSSCTLVEGLLFPVEYYIRTTRRMSSSQSTVDLGAVIDSQLSRGRWRRNSCGKRGAKGGSIHNQKSPTQDPSSQTCTAITSSSPTHITPESGSSQRCQSSSSRSKPIRGRKQGRGRGKRRGQHPRAKSESLPQTSSPLPPLSNPAGNPARDSQSGNVKSKLYPIFQAVDTSGPRGAGLPKSGRAVGAETEKHKDSGLSPPAPGLWGSLCLPPPGPGQRDPRPPPSALAHGLRFLLSHFDLKDFHLPDQEFGWLKLEKLKSSVTGSLEAFPWGRSPYNTRRATAKTLQDARLSGDLSLVMVDPGATDIPISTEPWVHLPLTLAEECGHLTSQTAALPQEERVGAAAEVQGPPTAGTGAAGEEGSGDCSRHTGEGADCTGPPEAAAPWAWHSVCDVQGPSTPDATDHTPDVVETGMLTQTMGGEEKRGGGERRAVTESLSFSCPNVAEDQGLLLPGAEVLGSATFLCPAPVENRWRTAVETQERLAGEGESPAVKTAWKDLPDPRDKPPGLNTGLPPGDLESGVAGTRLAAQVHSPLILNLTPASTQSVETPAPASWGSPAFPSLGLTPALPLPPSIPSLVASPSHPLRPQGSPQLLPLFRKRCRESSQTTQMEPQLAGLLERPQTEDRPPLPDETVEHFPDTFPLSLPLSPLIHPSPLPQVAECPPNSQQPTRCPSQTPSADSVQLSWGRESALKDGVDATPRVHCTLSGKPFLGQSALGMLSPLPPIPLSSTPQHLLSQAESNTPPGSQDREENGDPDRERSPLPQTAQSLTAHPPSQPSLPPQSPGEKPLLLPSADVLQLSLGVEEDLDSYFSDSMWTGVPGTQPPAPNKVTSPELSPRARQSPSACTAKDPVSAPSPASPKSPLPHPASLQLVHTLKAPAGPCLVDVCSVCCRGEDGALRECVVTAGEWAVSVWGPKVQGWSLLHTWTFTEHPVIGLEMLPDSPGLLCVTLGQLEIREARVLGCVSVDGPFSHTLLCAGKVQAVLGVSGCRVACCSQSESRQAVDLMRLSEEGRTEDTFSLASPGQSVRALAVVDGQKDALIGYTDSSDVLLWNMRTSHLLQRISLGLSYPGSMCLRGYSQSGVLFLLLQCVFVSTLDGEEGALFSLVATNPVTAKTSLAHSLSQPAQCPGRLVHGDVRGDAVAAVFQSGAVAVWAVGDSRVVTTLLPGPVGGWHLARWGGACSLLAGQLNGDVSLYHYSLPEP